MNWEIAISILTMIAGVGAICLGIYLRIEARKLKPKQTIYKADWVGYDLQLFEFENRTKLSHENQTSVPRYSVIEHLEESLEEVFE